jgi:hypothetical protein
MSLSQLLSIEALRTLQCQLRTLSDIVDMRVKALDQGYDTVPNNIDATIVNQHLLGCMMTLISGSPSGADLYQTVFNGWECDQTDNNKCAPYSLSIKAFNNKQFWITVKKTHTPDIQAEVCVEISNGLPVLHMSNEEFADNILHAFFKRDGVYVVPDNNINLQHVRTDEFYPGTNDYETVKFSHARLGLHHSLQESDS